METPTFSPGRTSLIVAHRLATVERCDVVAFLEVDILGMYKISKIGDLTIKNRDLTIKNWDLTIKNWDLTIKNRGFDHQK